MQTYFARRLVSVSEHLQQCHFVGMYMEHGRAIKPEEIQKLNGHLAVIAEEAEAIFLPLTALLARRLATEIDENNLHVKVGELESRFVDEITNIKFLLLNRDRLPRFENTSIAGDQFKTAFPKANVELIEAGNCFALDRYTACVFHVMRALEIGLIALEKKLGITAPPDGPGRTWGAILSRIWDKIQNNDRNPPADWQRDREFCHKAHALLQAIKAPYRDATMHVKSVYDEQGASTVLNVSIEALRFLATNLQE